MEARRLVCASPTQAERPRARTPATGCETSWQGKHLRTGEASAGSGRLICASCAIARACCRWATSATTSWASPSSASSTPGATCSQCHTHFPARVEDIKRGIWQAGAFPVELPALSLSESYVKPTTMLYRNFLAMEVEELLRQHPVDGAVLMGGCDKTTPATIMGAISANLPVIFMPAGPMMRGHFGGNILGSGSDIWKYWPKGSRQHHDPAMERHGGRHRPLGRHLHDDGHGLHHDVHHGGARTLFCRAPPQSRPATPPTRGWPQPAGVASSR